MTRPPPRLQLLRVCAFIAVKDWAVKRHITSLAFKTGRKGGSGPGPGLLHNKELKTYLTARLDQLALTWGEYSCRAD